MTTGYDFHRLGSCFFSQYNDFTGNTILYYFLTLLFYGVLCLTITHFEWKKNCYDPDVMWFLAKCYKSLSFKSSTISTKSKYLLNLMQSHNEKSRESNISKIAICIIAKPLIMTINPRLNVGTKPISSRRELLIDAIFTSSFLFFRFSNLIMI